MKLAAHRAKDFVGMSAEGKSVAQIARVHGVNANLVFNWRKLY
jgi:transposase-like protein